MLKSRLKSRLVELDAKSANSLLTWTKSRQMRDWYYAFVDFASNSTNCLSTLRQTRQTHCRFCVKLDKRVVEFASNSTSALSSLSPTRQVGCRACRVWLKLSNGIVELVSGLIQTRQVHCRVGVEFESNSTSRLSTWCRVWFKLDKVCKPIF